MNVESLRSSQVYKSADVTRMILDIFNGVIYANEIHSMNSKLDILSASIDKISQALNI